MSGNIMPLEQFVDRLTYTVRVEVTNDEDDTVATTEIELSPEGLVVNTDPVIEWLGKMKRGVFESDIKLRYDEYLESFED